MSPSTTATIAKAQETTKASLTSLLSPVGVSEIIVHSVGLQPDGELQMKSAPVKTRLWGILPGKSRPNLFRTISAYHSNFASTLRLPIAVTS